jgi:hypothetical protein
MIIRYADFKGELPLLHPRRLPVNFAAACQNCNLESGVIEPAKGLLYSAAIAKEGPISTIFPLGNYWVGLGGIEKVVKSPVTDSDGRIFYTDAAYLRQTNETLGLSGAAETWPTTWRRLGVKKPDYLGDEEALEMEIQGTGDGTTKRAVTYCYTCVTAFEEESRPSTPTGVISLQGGQYVRLKNFIQNTLESSGNEIKYFRLYRVTTGDDGNSEWDMVKARPGSLTATPVYDIPVSAVTSPYVYVYDANDNSGPSDVNMDMGVTCPSIGWNEAPDELEGLIEYQHGMIAGFEDNLVYVSEPFYYHAFPAEYIYKAGHNIKALGFYNEALIAATEAYPMVLIGSDPMALTKINLPYVAPCVSQRSLVSTPFGVFWAAPDGLFWTNGTDGKIITRNTFTKSDWSTFSLSSMIGVFYRGKYLAFFSGSSEGFIFDFNGDGDVVPFDVDTNIYSAYIKEDGTLYLGCATGGTQVYKWDSGSNLTWKWKSRVYETPPVNFSALKVTGEFPSGTSITAKIYADGTLKDTLTFTQNTTYRLSAGFLASAWQVEFTGTAASGNGPTLIRAGLATSMEELKNG